MNKNACEVYLYFIFYSFYYMYKVSYMLSHEFKHVFFVFVSKKTFRLFFLCRYLFATLKLKHNFDSGYQVAISDSRYM